MFILIFINIKAQWECSATPTHYSIHHKMEGTEDESMETARCLRRMWLTDKNILFMKTLAEELQRCQRQWHWRESTADKGRRVIPLELILLPSVISDLASCLFQFPLLPSLGGPLSGEIIERLFWGLLYCACALSLVTIPDFILPFISIVIFICFTRYFPVKIQPFSCFWF